MALLTQNNEQYYSTASPTPFGDYQFISIADIINNFMVAYVGEDKIISKIKRTDVQFHAMRGIQELSYDTLKSIKSQEVVIPSSLTMILPQDYVNYIKLTWSDSAGIEHIIYPASKTSNPTDVTQTDAGDYTFTGNALNTDTSSSTWEAYNSQNPSDNQNEDYDDNNYWPNQGGRFGLDPAHAQTNGSFYIDPNTGKIHFSSNINGKTVILKYISDGLGTDAEMIVHKFAEEAMYKHIAYSILSNSVSGQSLVPRFKKERWAAIRQAKLRLSNIKIEELTQILRGQSKQIKH